MDMSQYKDEFISEATDHLENINKNLLELEKNAEDQEIINSLFRYFHTLKGNSATMGFNKFSNLAHDLENILDKARNKEINIDSDLIDLLFEGCDLLQDGLDLISNDKSEDLDPHEILQKLKDISPLKDSKNPDEKTDEKKDIKKIAEFNDEEKKKIEDAKKENKNAFRVIAHLDKENPLISAKLMILFRDLKDNDSLLRSKPSQEEIDKNPKIEDIELIILSDKNKEDIQKSLYSADYMKELNVLGIEEEFVKNENIEIDDKEKKKNTIVEKHKNETSKQIQTVKIDIKRLDHLLNLVGELLISKIRLDQINKENEIKELDTVLAELDRLTLDIQNEIMDERMIPIGNIFNRYPRMVRDLAKKEEKEINFIIEGEEIKFDRTILDEIGDPLVHLIRNSVDHGVETPDIRSKNGKESTGTIKLVAKREKNNAVVEISDDGQGIDPEKIKASCIKKGMMSAEEINKMSENEIQRLIFKPGLSTNEKVTEISGRGVGMDVVENKVKSLGGNIKLNSVINKGTTVTLQLPLTVAIITALLIKIKDEKYAIPLNLVNKTVNINKSDIKTIQNQEVFVMRGIDIPIVWLHDVFGLEKNNNKKLTVVIIEKNEEKIGLVIDEIICQQQILIKNLNKMIKKTKGLSGATILGDGKVALIIDVTTLI